MQSNIIDRNEKAHNQRTMHFIQMLRIYYFHQHNHRIRMFSIPQMHAPQMLLPIAITHVPYPEISNAFFHQSFMLVMLNKITLASHDKRK